MIDLRSLREWLAETLTALADRLRPRPALVLVPPGADLVEPLCPDCRHERSSHHGGSGRCLDCRCPRYAGPWPVHHLHVTTLPCENCGVSGGHWAVEDQGQLLVVRSFRYLPPADPGPGAQVIPLPGVDR